MNAKLKLHYRCRSCEKDFSFEIKCSEDPAVYIGCAGTNTPVDVSSQCPLGHMAMKLGAHACYPDQSFVGVADLIGVERI
jgi:hypothetical protein